MGKIFYLFIRKRVAFHSLEKSITIRCSIFDGTYSTKNGFLLMSFSICANRWSILLHILGAWLKEKLMKPEHKSLILSRIRPRLCSQSVNPLKTCNKWRQSDSTCTYLCGLKVSRQLQSIQHRQSFSFFDCWGCCNVFKSW